MLVSLVQKESQTRGKNNISNPMEMGFKHFFFALLAGLGLILAVHAQDQSVVPGFISIACGANSSFTDKTTGINYTSDATFIDSGIINSISRKITPSYQRQVSNLRSFPQGIRNCYTINVTAGTKYLIRAIFLHGNYDEKGNLPEFDLYLGANMWDTVKVVNSSFNVTKELIHVPSLNYTHVCLVNTSHGTPFISAIELRPLKNTSYMTESGSLALVSRWDAGSNQSYRYPYDVHDRFWVPYSNNSNWKTLSTNSTTIDSQSHNDYQLPSIVMSTAAKPADDNTPLNFTWDSDNSTEYYVYMHFTEVEKLQHNQSRSFNITLNGKSWDGVDGPIAPQNLSTTTLNSTPAINGSAKYEVSIFKMKNSTLPPIINAIEIYSVKYLNKSETYRGDVDAIAKIKSTYAMKRNWQGDPCAPKAYSWEGLNCRYRGDNSSPRITSLNLSSSGLVGEISTDISNLVKLKYLDLSNNNLTGPVPDFLSQLQYLRVLDLSNNNLTGPVPDFLSRLQYLRVLNLERNQLSGVVPTELIARSENGSLSLSVADNPNLCGSRSCKKNKNNFVVPIVASLGGLLILSLIVAATLLGLRRRKHQDETKVVMIDTKSNIQNATLESIQGQFTYSELLKITNNFERILGKGGVGTVYRGNLDDCQVAVKILSPSYVQRLLQQFQSEVKLLMGLHHRNLTSLIGYCCEGTNMGLIYEYMAYGDLKAHLSGEKANILNWEDRLRIALDAAQGLEYLHHGCKPPIIHGDVKLTNILLTENLCAKLADCSLSKIFLSDDSTHVSTNVVGTPGYQDPEYYISNKLTEKTDIYSFGVVLLEIITSRHAIERSRERTHISQWLSSELEKGNIKGIVDPRLHEYFNINSAWKAVEIALDCLSPTSTKRPTMIQVVDILNECLSLELARRKLEGHKDETIDFIEIINMNLST